MKERFSVTGMTCSACSAHVEKAVTKLSGVSGVSVSLLQNSMTVEYDPQKVSQSDIISAVEKSGYGASAENVSRQKLAKPTDGAKAMKKRMIWSLVFLVPLFYICMGHMVDLPLPAIFTGHENMMIFSLVQLASAALSKRLT